MVPKELDILESRSISEQKVTNNCSKRNSAKVAVVLLLKFL